MMGANYSNLPNAELNQIAETSYLQAEDVKQLYNRFRTLDKDSRGIVACSSLLDIPEFALNPISLQMILFLERESPNGINFKSFVNFLSIFSSTSPLSLKLRFLFDLVDTSNDGAITNSDFTFFIQLLVGGYISQNFVSHITHSFMKDKSSLSFVDFCQVLQNEDFLTKMIIKV
eukprot:TRINITY_DN3416_c0_g1_i1.p1 TRINITY_DN3416_c0_g1~~TRINITY_DN3416_c0_g1_i1.p1  ORF type:complete len:174 (-),score=16.44 TRINITY_DN3416_c0_g1_i1:54-575(-)